MPSLGDQLPPIEPLGERSRARIERAVFDALEQDEQDEQTARARLPAPPIRRARGWVVAGGLALAAAAALLLWWRGGDPAGTRTATATAAPARIATGASGTRATFGEAVLDVGPDSALVMSGDDAHGVLVVLERGAASFAVAPRAGRPAFAVQAGEARVEVVGTRFAVARDGEGARVDVQEGVVRVHAHGQTTVLRAGDRWPAEERAAIAPAEPAPRAPPRPLEIEIQEPTLVPAPRSPPGKPGRARPAAPVGSAGPTTPQPPAEPGDEQRFARAARLEARDPAAALAIYAELAAGDGRWAANALFARARLLHERGDAAAARRAVSEYLRRFPHGANAEDARLLLGGR